METDVADRSVQLDIQSLRVFHEVVSRGGFTAAADALGMTQPAVSKKIRRLEDRLGIKLLVRDNRSLIVTAHGRDLLGHAREIIEAHDRAVDHIQRSELAGAVRLGCNEEVAASELSKVVGQFRRSHPDVDVAIRVHDSAYVADWLDAGEVDIALIHVIDRGAELRATDEIWRREALVAVQGHAADFDDADPVPLISFGPRCLYEPWLVARLESEGRRVRHAVECPSIHGVRSALEAGLGVGVLNESNTTGLMRPWSGFDDLDLPDVVFVVRSGVAPGNGDDIVEALRRHLTTALLSA